VQLVRETLESVLAPGVATATLFEALDAWGRGVPADVEQVLELVRGPLATLLRGRLGDDPANELLQAIEERLASREPEGGAEDIDESVELDVEMPEDSVEATSQLAAFALPVSVLVVSASESFAQRLITVLGDDRVYPHTVSDEAAFRHATFSALPLIAVVDCLKPPAIRPPALAKALRGLPKQTVAVVWAAENDYGREARVRIGQSDRDVVFLDRKEGIEPLLDLVLSRFKRLSTVPPPP
jgi:hypothetical protein